VASIAIFVYYRTCKRAKRGSADVAYSPMYHDISSLPPLEEIASGRATAPTECRGRKSTTKSFDTVYSKASNDSVGRY